MRQVPEYVKKHWASQIGAMRRDGKIPKHNDAIRAAWPKIPVGWLTDNYKRLIPYQEKLHNDFEEYPVTRPITADEADEVGEGEILKAFETVGRIIIAFNLTCYANKSRPTLILPHR
jgi:hypothetical protein